MSYIAIVSPGNERVKRAARLRQGTHRRDEGRTLVDGVRELATAAAAGATIEEVFFCPALLGDAPRSLMSEPLISELAQRGAEVFEVSEPVFSRLAYGSRAEGVVAVVATPDRKLDELTLPDGALVAVLGGVEKPGNIGAIVRSADAAGVSAVIVTDSVTDLFNPNAIRASLGTIFRVPVCATPAAAALDWLRGRKLQLVAARLDGATPPWKIDFQQPTAIILGAEATGLSPLWSADDVTAVRLPMLGAADSLNVSATAAVLFYEALRQRQD